MRATLRESLRRPRFFVPQRLHPQSRRDA